MSKKATQTIEHWMPTEYFVELLDKESKPIDVGACKGETWEQKVKKAADDAFWMLIGKDRNAPVITVGTTNTQASRPAINFAKDVYRFDVYGHELTDYKNGIHIYPSVNMDQSYVENAGVMNINGIWFQISARRNGKLTFEPFKMLDPVDHSPEIEARMQGQPDYRIKEQTKKEKSRAYRDQRRVAKHNWGFSYGDTFKVRVRYMPDFAEQAYLILTEEDQDKAWEMRNKLINGYVARENLVRGKFHKPSEPLPDGIETDTPDFTEGEKQDEPAQTIKALIFPYVLDDHLTNDQVDVSKLMPGTQINLYLIQKRGLIDGKWRYGWEPKSKSMVQDLIDALEVNEANGKPIYAIGCAENRFEEARA